MESLQDLNFKNINLYRRCIKNTTIFSKKKNEVYVHIYLLIKKNCKPMQETNKHSYLQRVGRKGRRELNGSENSLYIYLYYFDF